MASRLLFEAFGLGAYYLLVSLAVLDAVLLTRREVGQPWLRAGGWLLSLLGVTTFAALAVPGLSPGPGDRRRRLPRRDGQGAAANAVRQRRRLHPHRQHDPRRPAAVHRLRLGAAVGLGRGQADPRPGPRRVAGRRGLRPKAQPAAIRPRRLRRRRGRRPALPSACPAGRPTRKTAKTTKQRSKPTEAEPKTTDDDAAADGRKTLGSRVGISRPKTKKPEGSPRRDGRIRRGPRARPTTNCPSLDLLVRGRAVQLRRAREGGPPQGQDPRKDVRRFRLQHPRGRDSDRAGHRPVRGRTGGRACV